MTNQDKADRFDRAMRFMKQVYEDQDEERVLIEFLTDARHESRLYSPMAIDEAVRESKIYFDAECEEASE